MLLIQVTWLKQPMLKVRKHIPWVGYYFGLPLKVHELKDWFQNSYVNDANRWKHTPIQVSQQWTQWEILESFASIMKVGFKSLGQVHPFSPCFSNQPVTHLHPPNRPPANSLTGCWRHRQQLNSVHLNAGSNSDLVY